MQDELDAQLVALFAESRETLPSEEFMRAFGMRRKRTRRSRTLRRVGLIAVLAIIATWAAPAVLEQTAAAFRALGMHSTDYGELLVSPWGWAVSTLFGLAVLVRTRALRRR
ncbi:MAG TPA: hypothetical protein VHW71_15565 [Steroidobacteraceae bacterium]|nr:hypothetical protein [Steroidobacteraceae bacterium]